MLPFPVELLIEILSLLSIEDLKSFSSSCKSARDQALPLLFRHIRLVDYPQPLQAFGVNGHLNWLRLEVRHVSLDIPESMNNFSPEVARYKAEVYASGLCVFSNLQTLNIFLQYSKSQDILFIETLRSLCTSQAFTSLKSLTLSYGRRAAKPAAQFDSTLKTSIEIVATRTINKNIPDSQTIPTLSPVQYSTLTSAPYSSNLGSITVASHRFSFTPYYILSIPAPPPPTFPSIYIFDLAISSTLQRLEIQTGVLELEPSDVHFHRDHADGEFIPEPSMIYKSLKVLHLQFNTTTACRPHLNIIASIAVRFPNIQELVVDTPQTRWLPYRHIESVPTLLKHLRYLTIPWIPYLGSGDLEAMLVTWLGRGFKDIEIVRFVCLGRHAAVHSAVFTINKLEMRGVHPPLIKKELWVKDEDCSDGVLDLDKAHRHGWR